MSSKKKRLYSCRFCGQPYAAYPHDDYYTSSTIVKTEGEASIPIPYTCKSCNKQNDVFWLRPA
ncbi:MAG: hypothetical protein WAM14_01160 [Candidatus Nitrosopolaris sp.]